MQVEKIVLDRKQARNLYREYKKHQHYSEPMDDEIRRAYQLIAQGRMVIRAIESVRVAGLHIDGPNKGLPKLALCRADATQCFYQSSRGGAGIFSMTNGWGEAHHTRRRILLPSGSFPGQNDRSPWNAAVAQLPLIPVHLRPKRALASYHILWEAEWTRVPPRDPMLLRRIGKGDMWLVVAAWNLTEVERAALATRLNG